jgi:hypothetical protein
MGTYGGRGHWSHLRPATATVAPIVQIGAPLTRAASLRPFPAKDVEADQRLAEGGQEVELVEPVMQLDRSTAGARESRCRM